MSRAHMTVGDWVRRCCYETPGRCLLAALVSRVNVASRLPLHRIEAEVRRMFTILPHPSGEIVEGVALR